MASDSSDSRSNGPNSRHHLLRHRLSLNEEKSIDKVATEQGGAELKSKTNARNEQLTCKSNLQKYIHSNEAGCNWGRVSDSVFYEVDSDMSESRETEMEDLDDEELSLSEDDGKRPRKR